MSHWVYLNDATGPVTIERHEDGGTYVRGGTTEASINITYNYSEFMWSTLGEGGLRSLHEKRAGDVIEILASAVETLGTDRSADYWTATAGNAGYALAILLTWARQHPEAVFEVS